MVVSSNAPLVVADSAGVPWADSADYSQTVTTSGPLIFVSGQVPFDDNGALSAANDIKGQVRRTFENLRSVLAHHGAGLESVVSQTVYLARAEDFQSFIEVRREFFSSPFPAAVTVRADLLVPGMLVEISAVAVPGGVRTLPHEG